jgi:hypothetical protein
LNKFWRCQTLSQFYAHFMRNDYFVSKLFCIQIKLVKHFIIFMTLRNFAYLIVELNLTLFQVKSNYREFQL